jgi:hypothetical protein
LIIYDRKETQYASESQHIRSETDKDKKMLELLKKNRAMNPPPHGYRIYTSETGPRGRIVIETEFENLTEYEEHWKKGYSLPENAAFEEEWFEHNEPGGGSEILHLVE